MMDKLTPDKRQQAIAIQQKMMQMQMEHDDQMTQMEMKYRHGMMQLQSQLLDIYKGQ
jgi:GTP-binding protein EngB required for normal cell division